jgi:uncharacterized secreted repeat protein (TIGR03808 family)
MTHSRRAMLGLIGAGIVLPAGIMIPAGLARAQSDTARIQREIDEATVRGRPWNVPAGLTLAQGLRLPDGAHLTGIPGRSRLALAGEGPLLAARAARTITLTGVTFEGGGRPAARDHGLLEFRDIAGLRIQDCTVERAGSHGLLLERCGGRITGNTWRDSTRAALFATDSTGLIIDGNVVERSGENGILVWRSAKGDDGTIVRANRVLDTRATPGGTGQYGNAIGLYRAGGVIVEGNVIRRAAFTAVRNNGGGNVIIAGNNVAACGEVALYAEFGFEGISITANTVDGAWLGIVATNFADHGGRMAAISGNVIRNMRAGKHVGDGTPGGGKGIMAEGDAAITGNIIDKAEAAGLQLGWGPSLRDVTATGNTIRDCGVGVEISVAPHAGHAAVIGNTIAGSKRQAIVGMQWQKVATGDLAVTGAKDWPTIRLAENLVR